jgi:hypothetical protein
MPNKKEKKDSVRLAYTYYISKDAAIYVRELYLIQNIDLNKLVSCKIAFKTLS